jgi:hypothetical protein
LLCRNWLKGRPGNVLRAAQFTDNPEEAVVSLDPNPVGFAARGWSMQSLLV